MITKMFFIYSLRDPRPKSKNLLSPDITISVVSNGYDFNVINHQNGENYQIPYNNLVKNKDFMTARKILKHILRTERDFESKVFISPCAKWTIDNLVRINSLLVAN